MKRAGLLFVLLGVGCTGRITLSEDTDGGAGSQTDGDPSSTGLTEPQSDVSGSGDGPITTTPMPTTFGTTSGFGSSGFGSSGGPPPPFCWTVSELFETPEESLLFVVDQDGDGIDELWLSFFEGGGPGGTSELFVFIDGVPFPAGFFPGFFTGLHDIDGDQILDGVGFAFGGGGPPNLAFVPGAPASIEGDPIPTELGFEDGFDGFVDMTGDGVADLLRNAEGSELTELLFGFGDGQFAVTASTASPFPGDVSAMRIEDSETVVMAGSNAFEPLDECIAHPLAGILLGFEDLISRWVVQDVEGFDLTEPLAGWIVESESTEVVLARACDPQTGSVALALLESGADTLQTRLFQPSSFVAGGDFDGFGFVDLAMGDGLGITFSPNVGVPTFDEMIYDEVPYGEPVPTRVFVVDIDVDGRDEIILGTRDGGPEIVYQRLDYEPC